MRIMMPNRFFKGCGNTIEEVMVRERYLTFKKNYDVIEYDWNHRNLARIIKSSKADPRKINEAIEIVYSHTLASTFDHGEIWGRNRVPLLIVGHPYHMNGDDIAKLDMIRHLGLRILIHTKSFYNTSTLLIIIYSNSYTYPP